MTALDRTDVESAMGVHPYAHNGTYVRLGQPHIMPVRGGYRAAQDEGS